MNFRSILLSVILLPIASYGKNTENRIKELKELRYQAELKLSEFSEKVAEKDYLVTSIKTEYSNLLTKFIKNKSSLKTRTARNFPKKMMNRLSNQ